MLNATRGGNEVTRTSTKIINWTGKKRRKKVSNSSRRHSRERSESGCEGLFPLFLHKGSSVRGVRGEGQCTQPIRRIRFMGGLFIRAKKRKGVKKANVMCKGKWPSLKKKGRGRGRGVAGSAGRVVFLGPKKPETGSSWTLGRGGRRCGS